MAIFREICWKRLVLVFLLANIFTACSSSYSYEGEQSYVVNCQPCHGPNGNKGVGGAVNLQEIPVNEKHWKKVVMEGIPQKMPAFKSRISEKEWNALKEYLLYLNKD